MSSGRNHAGPGRRASDRDDAYRAYAAGEALLVPVPDLDPIRVTGADRLDFVHGQVSNEVRSLAERGTSEGLVLNHKGHALAQLRVVRRSADLYVAVEAGAGAWVREHFDRHIVFDQVELQDLGAEIAAWTLQGGTAAVERALEALGAEVPPPGTTVEVPFEDASLLVTPSRRSGGAGVDVHLLTRHVDALRAELTDAGALEAGSDVLPLLRVIGGLPHAAHEAGEGVLPQEAGLEPLISYRKGCYLGQEIMARIEARGTVRRGLRGVRLDAEPEGSDVTAAGRTVGRLGTIVRHPERGWMGLAVLRADLDVDEATRFGGVRGTVEPLPFEPAPA